MKIYEGDSQKVLYLGNGIARASHKKAPEQNQAAAQQVENLMAAAGAAVARERSHLLKLLVSLQAAGAIAGAAFAAATSYNLLAGVGWGLGVGSVNFSVCLLSSKERVR